MQLSVIQFTVKMFHTGFIILYYDQQTQLFHKLSYRYMFRHYHVILRQPVINTVPCHTGISNAAVGNITYN